MTSREFVADVSACCASCASLSELDLSRGIIVVIHMYAKLPHSSFKFGSRHLTIYILKIFYVKRPLLRLTMVTRAPKSCFEYNVASTMSQKCSAFYEQANEVNMVFSCSFFSGVITPRRLSLSVVEWYDPDVDTSTCFE